MLSSTASSIEHMNEITIAEILKEQGYATGIFGKWDLAGGGVELGETPKQAAKREAKEETNLDIKKEDVRIIHKSNRVPPPPLAYSKMIPIEDRDKIKKAVLEAHKHGQIGGYGGKMSHYMEVKDSDYNVLREVIELLNKS